MGLDVQLLLCSSPLQGESWWLLDKVCCRFLASAGQRFQHESNPPLPIPMSMRSEREGDRETGSPHELIFPS